MRFSIQMGLIYETCSILRPFPHRELRQIGNFMSSLLILICKPWPLTIIILSLLTLYINFFEKTDNEV